MVTNVYVNDFHSNHIESGEIYIFFFFFADEQQYFFFPITLWAVEDNQVKIETQEEGWLMHEAEKICLQELQESKTKIVYVVSHM